LNQRLTESVTSADSVDSIKTGYIWSNQDLLCDYKVDLTDNRSMINTLTSLLYNCT